MGSERKVLVCDDDDLLLDLLEHRLGARGFEVLIARDGGEALAIATDQQPDAILLDAMMPVMDGHEVLRRLSSEEATADIPVIMLTARKQERDILSALNLGARDYLVKPFIPEELITRLNRLIGSPK